ncbi:MAG: GIY-YIG nuclease family protein [Candidatus Acidiferrales bacterium]
MKTYYVYIMSSASLVLYTGVTNDIERRVAEHKQKRVPGFSARYNVMKLVYFETFGDIRAAIAREKQIKGWSRARKIALVDSLNLAWQDLGADSREKPRPRPQRVRPSLSDSSPATWRARNNTLAARC